MYWYNKNRNDMEKKKSKDRECNDENCKNMAIEEPGVFCSAVSISSILLQFIKHSLSISQRREGEMRKKNNCNWHLALLILHKKYSKLIFFSLLLLYSRFEHENIVRRKDWRNMIVNKATFALFLWKCHIRIIWNLIPVSAFLFW